MASQSGGLKVLSHNGVKVYCITGHKYGATPIPTNKLKSLKRDDGSSMFPFLNLYR